MWLMSVTQTARNLAHALTIDADGALTLPARRVSMEDLVGALLAATGAPAELVAYDPVSAIDIAFGRQPALSTPLAEALGFVADRDLANMVQTALSTLS